MYPQYVLGIERIDQEHSVLFDLLDNLTHLTYAQPTRDDCFAKTSELSEYLMTHLAHEERMLEQHGWPGIERHKLLHDAFSSQLDAFFAELMDNVDIDCLGFVEHLHDFVLGWLGHHVQTEDARYVAFIKGHLDASVPQESPDNA